MGGTSGLDRALDAASDAAAVVLHFPAPGWRGRLANHVRGLGRPRVLLMLAALALVPRLLVEAALPDPGSVLRTFTVALGVGACLLNVTLGTLAAVLQGFPARTVSFTPQRIRVEVDGAVEVHDWDWVVTFFEDDAALEILVQPPPVRSFQLAKAAPQRLVLPIARVDEETLAAMRALLRAHASGVSR
jgi:hypothetical protein